VATKNNQMGIVGFFFGNTVVVVSRARMLLFEHLPRGRQGGKEQQLPQSQQVNILYNIIIARHAMVEQS